MFYYNPLNKYERNFRILIQIIIINLIIPIFHQIRLLTKNILIDILTTSNVIWGDLTSHDIRRRSKFMWHYCYGVVTS